MIKYLLLLLTSIFTAQAAPKNFFSQNTTSPKKTPVYLIDKNRDATASSDNKYLDKKAPEQIIMTVCFGEDNFSRLVLAQVKEYCRIKKNLDPNLDITSVPLPIDNITNEEEKKPGLLSCFKDGALIFREVINAASIVRPAKAQEKFDSILGFNITREPLPTKAVDDVPTRSSVMDMAAKNYLRRGN
jgi:hypothetical protein